MLIGIKSVEIKTVCDFVIPPVLCVWGSLLEPHESVASSAQRQTSDPVSPLLLRTVTITKGGQGNNGETREKTKDELDAHVHLRG